MGFAVAAALVLVAGAGTAVAETADGAPALALGAIVGGYSPVLSTEQKAALATLLGGGAPPDLAAPQIAIAASAIDCRAGNVDIASFACELTFPSGPVHLSGRRAHELYATLAEVGVMPDGAAGSTHRTVASLRCTIDAAGILRHDGGGAHCVFKATP